MHFYTVYFCVLYESDNVKSLGTLTGWSCEWL